MKKIATLVLTVVLLSNISAPVFAYDVSSADHVHEVVAGTETIRDYTPRNSRPQYSESTVPVIQPRASKKCLECGGGTRIVKKGKYELAPCGHWAWWDGRICKDRNCACPDVDRVYLTCYCG